MMGRFLVMDVVFYGSSLNYDQGSGNYQELKKITRWDGRQYTLVSRYALRYSLLETGQKLGLWEVADGAKFVESGTGDKTVIQPAVDLLFNGDILLYPEFDLFGYLITSLTPQASRVSPTKLSHAISLTPFQYDTQFAGNLGLAKRRLPIKGKMDINIFTIEEHFTYYIYSIVVDVDALCKNEVYISAKDKDWTAKVTENNESYILEISGNKAKKEGINSKYVIPKERVVRIKNSQGNHVNAIIRTRVEKILDRDNKTVLVYHLIQELSSPEINIRAERLKKLLKAVLHLKRSIKGREEDLRPRLLVLGVYKNKPYQTFKDRIELLDEYTEEEYDEIEEVEENGKKILRVKHRVSKSRKPVFRIHGIKNTPQELNEEDILDAVEKLFNEEKDFAEVKVFKDPMIEVKLE